MKKAIFYIVLLGALVAFIQGHGMMLDPVGRGSRWRVDKTANANYNDNENFCGGGAIPKVSGYCGLCGDPQKMSMPRPHELGGLYGQGTIVRKYIKQKTIDVTCQMSANHLGHFEFQLCNLDKHQVESEECFKENQLDVIEGGKKHYIGSQRGIVNSTVVLPSNLKCNHCVFRWVYRTANSWGVCDDGSGALGCGSQETFVNCADIEIQ